MLIAAGEEAATLGIIGGLGGLLIFFYIIFIAIIACVSITLLVFWIISIIDVSQRKNEEFPNATENSRQTWLIVLLVTLIVPVAAGISAIVYYVNVMKKMPRNTGKPALPPDEPPALQS
jgi:cellulose synthase/poly-beta-1,6-N-acetylglucosamine synthase-like glycosyltransferase